MTHKTLGWAFVLAVIVLLVCLKAFDASVDSPKAQSPVVPKTEGPQPRVLPEVIRQASPDLERKARENAQIVISDTLSLLKDLDQRETPESRQRHREQKIRKYRDLFSSWELNPETTSDALNILESRNQQLEEINQQMLSGKVQPHVAAKAIIESKRVASQKLADILGDERSAELSAWEKPERRTK